MNRILLAVVVLALMVGCVWASTETASAAGFTVIPDNEASQMIGGDGVGYECNQMCWPTFHVTCEEESQSMCSDAYAFNETRMCGYTGSGQCYEEQTVVGWWAECEWTNECHQVGDWQEFWGTTCWW
jgi:hypothetical protein